MAIKKLKLEPQSVMIPEGLYSLPTPIMLYQKATEMLWANPAFEKEFGVALRERFMNKSHLNLIQSRPLTLDAMTQVGRHEGLVIENLNQQKSPVELRVTPYGEPQDECYLVMVEEVSAKIELQQKLIENHVELQRTHEELKATQSALIQAAKLASLGELASGVAHELNQPLQAILGFSQELQQTEKLSKNGTEFLDTIVSASQKMAEIIKSLRSFAREAGEELSPTSVSHALSEALKLMHHQMLQADIEVEVKNHAPSALVTANPIQLEQVLMNLMSNARDAILSAKAKPGKISIQVHEVGKTVEVRIHDNGCGMDEKTQTHAFDPFFTTKEVGEGTGLGLSVSYGLIKKFNAKVEINSALGEGTEFILTLNKDKK